MNENKRYKAIVIGGSAGLAFFLGSAYLFRMNELKEIVSLIGKRNIIVSNDNSDEKNS